jgi:hypothetical protein
VRRFAARTLAFFAPIFGIVFAIEALLWRVGETWPLERVIRAQEINRHAIFSRGLIDQGTFRYKYLQILRQRPRILVLGSSRVMQFRAEMFGRQGPSFYNAGGIIHSIDDLASFLDHLPQDATPQTVILGVDFWWLNANAKREANDSFATGVDEDGADKWQGHVNVVSSYVRNPASLRALLVHTLARRHDPDAIGLQATLHRQGFRYDGSRQFNLKIPNTPGKWPWRGLTGEKLRQEIIKGGLHFNLAGELSPVLMQQLREALLRLKARGIFVLAYSPPVVSEWLRLASTTPEQKEYWRQYHEKIPALFRSLEIPFLDIITPEQLGLDDRYMTDGYHPHDTFDLYVLQRFCDDPQVRRTLPDVPFVARQALDSPATNPLYLDFSRAGALPNN